MGGERKPVPFNVTGTPNPRGSPKNKIRCLHMKRCYRGTSLGMLWHL